MTATVAQIESKMLLIRSQKVMLDEHLAALYGVETKVLLQAVKRNLERFPDDFMFQLDAEEWQTLKSQIVTSNEKLVALEKKYDTRFKAVFDAIHELMSPPEHKKKRPIGFTSWEKK